MRTDDLLNLTRLPARLDAAQVAAILGFAEHDMPVLVRGKLLKPLGSPAPNAHKYFATVEIVEHAEDRDWLDKATRAVSKHWQSKNQNVRDTSDVTDRQKAA
jgi:hypothetical protein